MKKLLLLPLLMLLGFAAGAQCQASFTAVAQPQGNNLLRWNFTNTSTYGTVTGVQYITAKINYGDGSSFNSGNASGGHNYAAPGTYTVGLRIKKIDSLTQAVICTDSTTQVITVAYSPCASSFTVFNGTNGQRTFTASTPGATGPMTYTWYYGDGYSGTGSPSTHIYSSNGTYFVTLMASGGGCSYVDSQLTNVQGVAPSCSSLHALFSTSVSSNVVTVSNTSTSATGLSKISTLNYGDGSANTTSNTHTYTATGTYTIKLKVQWIDTSSLTVYCQDSITHNVTISTVPTPPNSISGYVWYDSLAFSGQHQFRVWLIQHDSATNSLSAVDSVNINGSTYIPYQFTGKPSGAYFTKAAMLNQTVGNLGVLPTYHDSSLYWASAQTIYHPGTGNTYANIHLKTGTVTSGPGFVSGNVSLGANKGAGAGVAGIQVYIRNSANEVVAGATTDANGDFSLYSLPTGTYNVYPEHINYATTPATSILVTNGTSSVTNVNFNQDNTLMNIKPRNAASVTTVNGNVVVTISPNPASKAVTISWKGVDAKGAHLIITSITGSVIMDKAVSNATAETLDVSNLRAGIYFLRGTGGLQGKAQKLVIE